MIPIVGSGVNVPGAASGAAAPQRGADADSAGDFPAILGAREQAVATGAGDSPPQDTNGAGGNPVLPGGKNLPPRQAGPGDTADDAPALSVPGTLIPPEIPAVADPRPEVVAALPEAAERQLAESGGRPLQPVAALSPVTPAAGAAQAVDAPVEPGAIARPQATVAPPVATSQARVQAAPVPPGPQALLAATPEPPADRPPGGPLATADRLAGATAEAGSAAVVQPRPVPGEPLRESLARPGGVPWKPDAMGAAVPADSPSLQATPPPERREPPASLPLATASAGLRPQAPVDEVLAVRAVADTAAPTPGAETARPVATAPALPAAPLTPLGLLPADSVTLPAGSRVDVTGVLVSHPGEHAFNAEVAGRVSLMVRNGTAEANLQLNPPELGRMEVRIATEGDQARILFTVQGAETRDVIEQALPRLRDMLEQGGLSLARFDVADRSGGERQGQEADTSTALNDHQVGSEELPAAAAQVVTVRADALVDYYV